MMDINALNARLKAYHEEEVNDHKKYCELADEIEHDHPRAAGVLRDIAHDEKSHAEALAYVLGHMGG